MSKSTETNWLEVGTVKNKKQRSSKIFRDIGDLLVFHEFSAIIGVLSDFEKIIEHHQISLRTTKSDYGVLIKLEKPKVLFSYSPNPSYSSIAQS